MNTFKKSITCLSIVICLLFSYSNQVFAASTSEISSSSDTDSNISSSQSISEESSSTSISSDSIIDDSSSLSSSSSSTSASSSTSTNSASSDSNSEDSGATIDTFSYTQGTSDFVRRLYEIVLDRTADTSEIDFWAKIISDGQPASFVIQVFFNSEEYLNKNPSDSEYITSLYLALFNRSPSAEEINFWLQYLSGGVSRDFIMKNFVQSGEFSLYCNDYGIAPGSITLTQYRDLNPTATFFINRFYVNCLERPSTVDDLNFWTGALYRNEVTAATIIESFFLGEEFSYKNTDDSTFLHIVYRTLLGREADAGGLSTWTSVLNEGYSRRYILYCFFSSPEFVQSYQSSGITSGTISLSSSDYPSTTPTPAPTTYLTVKMNGTVVTDTSENILSQIVTAEVGGLNNTASYQAQAIAAHSYILNLKNKGTVASVVGKTPTQAVRDAVAPVSNIVVTYNGSIAFTPYYASNAGTTNYNKYIWGEDIPYLVQVDSHHDVDSSNYSTTKIISRTDFMNIMRRVYGNNQDVENFMATQPPSTWIIPPARSSGSLYYGARYMVSVCSRKPSIEYFYQNIVGIRSAAFDVRYDAGSDSFVFTSYGYGHGVGMSQWGSYYFATRDGWNYGQILSHYYPGTTLGTV